MRIRRPWLLPLVPVYGAGMRVAHALGRAPRRLGWPVISVGSLSAGGAGKTPVVKLLAGLLARHGVEVDVLSRGYGRGSGVVERVDGAGEARRFGDEPMELARAGLRVFVGAQRLEAGRLAELTAKDGQASDLVSATPRVHLLDDGFQHRRLARELDVVLLTAEDVADCLLPAGNLREPLSAMGRADVIVLREDEAGGLAPVAAGFPRAEVWMVRRSLHLPAPMPVRPVAFCGIARPDSFFAMLQGAGCATVGRVAFADHHDYGDQDVHRLSALAEHAHADGFVTTAKDAVKLTPGMQRTLEEIGPVAVAELKVCLVDEDRAWRRLAALLPRASLVGGAQTP